MSSEQDIDKSFQYFEELNFSGWLIQLKAMLRELNSDDIIATPIPKNVDANGQPIPMNARERHDFNRELRAYKELDKMTTIDTTPSPHRRISTPRSLLTFAHIHGEQGIPTGRLERSGGSERSVSGCRRGC
jgi:hypothetical protein